ncbi:RE1 [Symbiodinium sp. KB8]|nr:RE1 [Symbiodinium sp. KB8]
MSDMNREELVEALAKLGVEAPRGWTKIEMQLRLEQITGQDMAEKIKPKTNKGKSPFQEMVTKLNQASRRKSVLLEFVTNELRMSNMDGYTIDRIKMAAIRRIYDVVEAHDSDQLGFGKHSAKSYAEVWTTDPGYCNWVRNTAKEPGNHCDPRLSRFAKWLAHQDEMELKPPTPKETDTLKRGRKKSQIQETTAETNVLQALMEQVAELKNEVKELRQDSQTTSATSSQEPTKTAKRRRMVDVGVKQYMILGTYAYGNHYGITNKTRQFPQAQAAHVNEQVTPSKHTTSEAEKERIRRQLYLLHAATGHGSTRHLIEALKRRKAKPEVLELAKQFKCSICAEKQRITPRHLASLEVLPPRFHTIAADIGHWQDPRDHVSHQFMLIIDEGSRFRVARFVTQGSKQQPNAATCLHYLREGWSQYFGLPRTLRLDPAGAFRSEAVVSFCERNGIYLENIPADAHWQLGVCEQAVQGLKTIMTKLAETDADIPAELVLAVAVQTFNSREQVRGFSPMQHVFGQSPDSTGRIIGTSDRVPEEMITESATEDLRLQAHRRASAEKALADWQASQRISRAMNSRTRPVFDYQPGELVYYWRSQVSGQSRKHPGSKHGYFLGPARILATEQRRDAQGCLYPGSAVWCVRGRNLVKCCPEQLRRASEREELLEALAGEHTGDATPWTFEKVADEIGGNQYEDASQERPPLTEWQRAQDPEQEVPPQRFRLRGKRPLPPTEDQEMELGNDEDATPSQPSRPGRKLTSQTPRGHPARGEAWYHTVAEASWSSQDTSYWAEQSAAVEVEVALPQEATALRRATHDLRAYFTGALRRRAVEVHEKHLNESERAAFREAKEAEVRNFVAAEAFEALPEHLRPSRDQAVNMRWLLTWKVKEDGSRKAKARAVLLGYQDPSYAQRETAAPVMTRQTRQLLLQVAASRQWSIHKGDVTGAFLQGRSYPDTLYCIPTDEICHAMGLQSGAITKLKRACYGLVDAPLEWYRTVAEFLEEIGLTRTWSDACCWTYRVGGELRGIIAGHVDDFLFTGSARDPGWQEILAKIKARFKWGDWDTDDFVQCGVQIKRVSDGFELSQERYVADIPDVPLNSSRRKETQESTTPWEKTKLRASLGALSWHAQQTAPHVAAEVGLLLSEVNCSTVATIVRVNQLVQWTKDRKDYRLKIHGFSPSEPLGVYVWVDAASQNRVDGGSTQGYFLGLAPQTLIQGEVTAISPMGWGSHKIDRACRSPGAAETQAAVNGEDEMFFLRFQWSELLFGITNVRAKDQIVARIPGCVITDSRNVYDKMMSEVVSIKGAEKRANIELLGLKESQWSTKVQIRWVHSEAQLANALTKAGSRELELFYKMGFRWRIVEDEKMRSARRRKAQGLEPLEGSSPTESRI